MTLDEAIALFPKGTSAVYFVGIGKHMKIGFTTHLAARMKSFLTSAVEVEFFLALPGNRELERRLHETFAWLRVRRELFNHDYRMMGFIEHAAYEGIERGLRYLEEMLPDRIAARQAAYRIERRRIAQQTRAEENAYYAGLVAERKRQLGW